MATTRSSTRDDSLEIIDWREKNDFTYSYRSVPDSLYWGLELTCARTTSYGYRTLRFSIEWQGPFYCSILSHFTVMVIVKYQLSQRPNAPFLGKLNVLGGNNELSTALWFVRVLLFWVSVSFPSLDRTWTLTGIGVWVKLAIRTGNYVKLPVRSSC